MIQIFKTLYRSNGIPYDCEINVFKSSDLVPKDTAEVKFHSKAVYLSPDQIESFTYHVANAEKVTCFSDMIEALKFHPNFSDLITTKAICSTLNKMYHWKDMICDERIYPELKRVIYFKKD